MQRRLLLKVLWFVVVLFRDNIVANSYRQQHFKQEGDVDSSEDKTGLSEYCNFETFNASCPEGYVVYMMRALYGRMKLGRCLKSDVSVGCHSDVLRELDARCSGQPSCSIAIPDANLHQTLNCPDDMMAYLQASYKCLQATQANLVSDCDEKNPTRITAPSVGFAYLSSYLMRSHGWINCHISITAPPGQRIELFILDFSPLPRYRTEADIEGAVSKQQHTSLGESRGYQYDINKMLDYCHVYVVVIEAKVSKDLTVCHGSARESHVYSSTTNSVLLKLSDHVANDRSASFLIKYGVSGCPDLAPPKNAWIRRSREQASVTCNSSGSTWHLVCKGTNWVGQEAANDCEEKSSQEEGLFQGPSFPTYGLLTAVITGVFIGAVCGFSLLGAVLWCKRRSGRSRNHKECSLQMIQDNMRVSGPPTETTEYDGSTYDPHYHHHHHHHHGFYAGQSRFAQPHAQEHFHSGGSFQPPCKVHHRLENGEYGYTHVWEIAGNEGESKQLAIMGSEEPSPDSMALNFSAYSPSSYSGARQVTASPMTSQGNLMVKQSVSSFKPLHQEAKEVCPYQSCSKQHPANYTFVKLSDGSQAVEGTAQQQKPILEHPSLLQDHVQKLTNPTSDLCSTPAVPIDEWCTGNSKDCCRPNECCSSDQSKVNLKKLENHYT